jgi:hypothetical protein
MALGIFSALALLITNLLSSSGVARHVSSTVYARLVIYSEVPLALACAFILGLLVRRWPLAIGLTFAGQIFVLRLLFVTSMITLTPFWIESALSLIAAPAGACAAVAITRRLDWHEPVHPFWVGLAAVILPCLAWFVTYRLACS